MQRLPCVVLEPTSIPIALANADRLRRAGPQTLPFGRVEKTAAPTLDLGGGMFVGRHGRRAAVGRQDPSQRRRGNLQFLAGFRPMPGQQRLDPT
ncbi:MAG TPA: hypothetical protein VG013_07180 [Gemmataceae bacterium]|nr:hypothetical protein [Gemmataceae bacterium]